MIEPVVFPFTYLDTNTAGLFLSCFPRIRILIPSDSAREELDPEISASGRVALCNPLPDSGQEVDRIFSGYRQWRQANMGTDISFFKSAESGIPFFDESTISYLKQGILDSASGKPPETKDLLLAARVFLRMTGNYDHFQTEITASLFSQDAKKMSMLAALRGENDEENEDNPDADATASQARSAFDETGELLTSERLAAWAVLAGRKAPSPNIFATPSRAVVAAVLDHFESTAVLLDNIPVPGEPANNEQWRNDLADFLENMTRRVNASPDKDRPPLLPVDSPVAFLTIIHLPGVSSRSFLDKFQHNHLKTKEMEEQGGDPSTVVAAVLT